MGNIYDGAFRTMLNDCRKLIIPVIGAFDKRTIIEISKDVLTELAKKYTNVQKRVGDIMGGALIETSARKLKKEAKKEVAVSLLKIGKLTVKEIAECSELDIVEVEQLAKNHVM